MAAERRAIAGRAKARLCDRKQPPVWIGGDQCSRGGDKILDVDKTLEVDVALLSAVSFRLVGAILHVLDR